VIKIIIPGWGITKTHNIFKQDVMGFLIESKIKSNDLDYTSLLYKTLYGLKISPDCNM
jgi:hypothetical protein